MVTQRTYQEIRRLSEAAIRDEMQEGRSFSDSVADNQFLTDFRDELHGDDKFNSRLNNLSFRELFEHLVRDRHGDLVGNRLVESWNPRKRQGGDGARLFEADVSTANFANIMGQITYASVLPVFEWPAFLAPQIARTVPTPFEQEKIPGIANPGDVTSAIPEGHEFPKVGIGEHFIETAITQKHGAILQITKEALFFDRTGLILDRARSLAQMLAIDKEKRVLDVALGLTNTYRRNGAAAIASYGDNSGSHDWDNLAASNALADWTDIEAALLLFDGITDPDTGEPVFMNMEGLGVVVPTALVMTLDRIINATEVRSGDITAGAGIQTIARNARAVSSLVPLSNQYVKDRTSSATTWFIGDWMNSVTYRENWPIQTPPDAVSPHDEIHRDIVAGVKVTERGAATQENPRVVVKCTA